ncbi:MAG: hypothetical protein QXD04_04385 [Candidatus Bathyarchaeia archaeon]
MSFGFWTRPPYPYRWRRVISNIYNLIVRGEDKDEEFLSTLKKTDSAIFELLERFYSSFERSSPLIPPPPTFLIDPITGKRVTFTFNAGHLTHFEEELEYPYPYASQPEKDSWEGGEEVKTSEQTEETILNEEKEQKEVLLKGEKREPEPSTMPYEGASAPRTREEEAILEIVRVEESIGTLLLKQLLRRLEEEK